MVQGMIAAFLILLVSFASPAAAQNTCKLGDGTTVTLANLGAGQWCEVDGSKLFYTPAGWPDGVPGYPTGYSSKKVTAESGAVYIPARDQLVVFGGGHAGYFGNEVYLFDVPSLTWMRLTDPSLPTPEYCGSGPAVCVAYDDGLPRSRHTYDSMVYLPPPDDHLCNLSVQGTWRQASAGGYNNIQCFDFNSGQWLNRGMSTIMKNVMDFGALSARHPVTGIVYARSNNKALQQWNPATNAWSPFVSSEPSVQSSSCTADIAPERNELWASCRFVTLPGAYTGPTRLWKWNLAAPNTPAQNMTGLVNATCLEFASHRAPGFVWHPPSQKFVAWFGTPTHPQPGTLPPAGDVFTLDPATNQCVKYGAAADSQVPEQSDNPSGVYGRWQYSAALDVFIAMQTPTQSVHLYRLP